MRKNIFPVVIQYPKQLEGKVKPLTLNQLESFSHSNISSKLIELKQNAKRKQMELNEINRLIEKLESQSGATKKISKRLKMNSKGVKVLFLSSMIVIGLAGLWKVLRK